KARKFPRRCWFARFAGARSVGCNSKDFGELFAAKYLRKGAGITTTTRSVAPACSPEYQTPSGHCSAIDAISFVPKTGEAVTPDHGPFPLKPDKFHGSAFWEEVGGKL